MAYRRRLDLLRQDVCSRLGMLAAKQGQALEEKDIADEWVPSDGIARVHGMNNVQAEELVE